MRLQGNVIRAVFWRNFFSYFSNPIGYLFITAFVLLSAYFAFWHNDAFFASNLADLDQLNLWFPYLLLFFIPAITMSVWAEERRSGTEELLLTLPASDLEIVVGKYLSCLAIYTVSLLFSVSHVIVLAFLGDPDRGLMASTFLGYWLLGASLLSAGMVASLLTSNVTVAFILGSAICVALVSVSSLAGLFTRRGAREFIENFGVIPHFEPFGKGLVSLTCVLYFVSLTIVMLYLNMVLLGRRHWAGSADARGRWGHLGVRAASLALIAVSVTLLASRAEAYLSVDATEERIFSLSPETKKIIADINPARPVLIEAFVSPKVPRELVETRKNLLDLLRQFDAIGGNKIEVQVHDAERLSQSARDAERVYGIRPEIVPAMQDGRFGRAEVFLGVAFKSGLNSKTIPFFYRGLPIEYELARMVRTVSQAQKRKVGILNTDAQLFGSFNFQTFEPGRNWLIVEELKQQFEVIQVSPDAPIEEKLDVLIVPMVSSLSQPQIDNLVAYVSKGHPTLLLDDPMPFSNPRLAAKEPKQRPQNPMMGMQQPPPVPKGDLSKLMNLLNIDFDAGNIVYQVWNPHPQYRDLPPEYVFIGKGSGNKEAFNPDQPVTSGLQEQIFIYPGALRPRGGDGPKFIPLIETGPRTGVVPWNDVFEEGVFGMRSIKQYPRRRPTGAEYVLAAAIKGPAAAPVPADAGAADKKDVKPADINVIFIADLDMISDAFFELRRQGEENLQFDNVPFVLNCVDVLAGDEAFVELRKKRLKRRNLERIAEMTKDATLQAQKTEEKAEESAQEQLKQAQTALDDAVAAIRKRTDISERDKRVQIEFIRQSKQREFDISKDEIDRKKKQLIDQERDNLDLKVRDLQSWIKILAVALPPIPALLMGIAVFFARRSGEREGVDPRRLA